MSLLEHLQRANFYARCAESGPMPLTEVNAHLNAVDQEMAQVKYMLTLATGREPIEPELIRMRKAAGLPDNSNGYN